MTDDKGMAEEAGQLVTTLLATVDLNGHDMGMVRRRWFNFTESYLKSAYRAGHQQALEAMQKSMDEMRAALESSKHEKSVLFKNLRDFYSPAEINKILANNPLKEE